MATDWAQLQTISAAAGLLVAAVPAGTRAVRRRLVRARLRQHLDLAGAVRQSGQPAAELDPVLTELISLNLANLARLEAHRLPAGRPHLGWRFIQVVAVFGWALAAAIAILNAGNLRHDAVGLLISVVVVDAPLLILGSIVRDLLRRRTGRGRPGRSETLAERTQELTAELVPTLPLGHRNTMEELLGRRSDLGPRWRTGRAPVPDAAE